MYKSNYYSNDEFYQLVSVSISYLFVRFRIVSNPMIFLKKIEQGEHIVFPKLNINPNISHLLSQIEQGTKSKE
jgi:hypothetical protein